MKFQVNPSLANRILTKVLLQLSLVDYRVQFVTNSFFKKSPDESNLYKFILNFKHHRRSWKF